ncbi:MAG: ABC transporter ATP-binding protein [Nitrospinota bacterium]
MTFRTDEGPVPALEGVRFEAGEGEFVSILGPSGCGKSTLLKLIAGLMPPSRGSIKVSGTPVDGPNRNIGIVFQNPILMNWRTSLENIMIQAEVRGLDRNKHLEVARDLIKLVGLSGFENKYPFQLSGGMAQRVSLCRALIHDPPLLLMDEPFAALDALTREKMNLELQRIWLERKKTVLFITHSIPEALFLSDRVLLMSPRPGSIIEVISIDFSRPRELSTMQATGFNAIVGKLRLLMHSAEMEGDST